LKNYHVKPSQHVISSCRFDEKKEKIIMTTDN